MKRIYLAGKLNDSAVGYIKNVSKMIKAAVELRRQGHAVFCPGLDFLMGIQAGYWEYYHYADNNMAWLEVADEIHVLPNWETSDGTKHEIKRARELGIPVIFIHESPMRKSVERDIPP